MKLFNIDMHISIAHDVKTLLPQIGHTVESVCMSGHTWVNGEPQGKLDVVSPGNFAEIDQSMCDRFYARYRSELEHYDGFIHSYPPAFALLFERWNKPVFTIACTRYEFPCGSGRFASQSRLKWLNDGLVSGQRNGQFILIANNLFDKKYCETFCGGEWIFVPSVCSYLEDLSCDGSANRFIIWDRNRDGLRGEINNKRVDKKFSISEVYDRRRLIQCLGIIHLPYNISIMSAFEHYAMGIPMYVPSFELMRKWKNSGRDVLSELEFSGNLNVGLEFDWIKLSDWYDPENMPEVIQFDSLPHLQVLLDEVDRDDVSKKMKKHYWKKKERVLNLWKGLLN